MIWAIFLSGGYSPLMACEVRYGFDITTTLNRIYTDMQHSLQIVMAGRLGSNPLECRLDVAIS